MWFERKKLARFVMVLAMAVSAVSTAWAAEEPVEIKDTLYPLYFKYITGDDNPRDLRAEQQLEWSYLMKYKMFGAHGIRFENKDIFVTDSVGWFGTADGDWTLGANGAGKVGGPVLIGGNVYFEQGPDSILTGPMRVTKSVSVRQVSNYTSKPNGMLGVHCVASAGDGFDAYSNTVPVGNLFAGDEYANCPDSVPEVKSNLRVPSFKDAGQSLRPAISINGAECFEKHIVDDGNGNLREDYIDNGSGRVASEKDDYGYCIRYIDVPEGVSTTPYDIYIEGISFSNKAKLVFRMQNEGRLTRVFLRDALNLSSSGTKIQIEFMDGGSYDSESGKWTGTGSIVENKDYSGQLLFYTQQNITFPTLITGDTLQGTYISEKKLSVSQHTILAGQLLADTIFVDTDFDGSGFRYVPYNSAEIDFYADESSIHFAEGDAVDTVQISLDKKAENKITLEYCFALGKNPALTLPSSVSEDDFAVKADFDLIKDPNFPICEEGKSRTASFKEGSKNLVAPIVVYVDDDSDIEEVEYFTFRVLDISGAKLKKGGRTGDFPLYIDDNDKQLISVDGVEINVTEDEKFIFSKEIFPITEVSGTAWTQDFGIYVIVPPYYDSLRTMVNWGENQGLEEPVDYKREIGNKKVGIPSGILDGSMGWNLVYNPPKDSFGVKFDSLEYRVLRDGLLSDDTYKLYINILPVNDPPDAHDTTFNFMENLDTKAGAVPSDVKIRIEDVDDESYTFAWSEKYDDNYTKAVLDRVKELYDLDPNTGVISAKQDAALDYESGDSVLVAKIVVSDKNGGTGDDDQIKRDIIVATIKINDVNEDPVVKPGQTFTISEFAGQDPSIPVEVVANDGRDASEPQNKVLASDVDLNKNPPKGWGYLTYTIEENPNFAIDPVTGVISVKEGADIDFEDDTKNSFTLTVTVTDGGGKSASAEVTITVSNENETPKFVDDGTDNYIALEHSKPDTVVKRWAIDDPDADDDASNLNVSLEDVHSANSVLATDVFDVRIVEESGSMFVELFVSDSAKLDFESIYDALSGDTTFAVKITLSDDEGGSSSLEKKIKVHDVNELHVAQPLNPTIDENPRKNAVVDTVKVLDPDTKNPDFRKYEYSIVEKDVPFAMSDSLIVVADSSKLDYETVPGHKFEIHVAIVDKNDPTLADTAVVVITLKDVDESPKIIPDSDDDKCDDMVTNCTKPKDPIPEDCADGHCGNVDKDNNVVAGIRENSATGTVVMEYYVVDEDGDDDDLTKLKVELKDNNKTGVDSLFGVKIVPAGADSFKVQVYVKDGSKLDYEAVKNTHNVSIIVTDTTKNGDGFNNPVALSDSIVRIIQVIDVNEPPYVVKKTFEFNEHSAADTVVGKIEWGDDNDLEGVSTEAYRDNKVEIIGGSDGYKDLFSVDSNGVIKTKKEFNFETEDPTYTLIVKVVDKNVPELFVIDTMTIKLLNIPEIPHIVNVTTSVDEHVPPKTPIDTLESRDPDCLDSAKCKYTYELVKDNPYVTVDPDGVIRVADSSKINFEEITKIDIVVRVTDEDGESSDTTITIKINDVNEPPHLKDDVCNVYENAAVNSTVCKLTAKDPDTNPKFNKLEYEQITDNDVFDVLTDGTIKLKKPLDYEKDSVYVIKVRVNDGEFSDIATITINVRDIDEKSNVEITKVIDDDSTYVRPDSVYTNSHVVQLCWHEGRTENKGSTAWGKDICEQDTLTPGRNVITKLYYDETTNYPAVDSVVIFYSNALPTVTISANGDGVSAHNIYTIVEATDKKDTNIYVNKESNDIYITVTDPSKALMGDKDSVKTIQIPTNLKPTTVDQKSYERLNYVMTAGVSVDPVSDPKKNSVSRNVNADSSVTISYVEKVAGVDVVVSYVLDKKGDVVKTPVTHSDGKVSMEEVITVSYTNKDGVTISYMAESGLKSGEVYKMDAQGNLLTSGAAEKLGKTITGNPIAGVYTVSYGQVSANGDSLKVTYSVDGKGKIISSKEGDIGYSVSYTYTDICGNSATEAVYIVLDQQPPRVGIIYPSYGEVIHSNFTNVIWGLIIGQDDATLDASKRFEVDSSWVLDKKHPSIYVRQLKTKRGEVAYDTVLVQDTLSTQGLDKGTNSIVRFYRDKAGNEAADTVYVVMKDGKDVALSVEQPVTIMSKDLVEKYYAKNPLKLGQTYAVSILNPTENKEVETLKGGNFGTKKGSGNEPYPGLDNHLGPTLKLDVRLPVISGKDGLATLDDIMSKDGKVLKYGIDADGEIKGADEDGNVPDTVKIDVDDYVQNHCTDDVIGKYKSGKETSLTLYKSTLSVKIWIYTTLGNFVDYYTFSQDLNDPDLVDEAGMLKMFFELKPDKNGEIRSEDGRVMATGAYLYKVEAKIRSDLLCDLPPLRSAAEEKKGLSSGPKKGEKPIKRSEELLKSFGYKRPANK